MIGAACARAAVAGIGTLTGRHAAQDARPSQRPGPPSTVSTTTPARFAPLSVEEFDRPPQGQRLLRHILRQRGVAPPVGDEGAVMPGGRVEFLTPEARMAQVEATFQVPLRPVIDQLRGQVLATDIPLQGNLALPPVAVSSRLDK